MTTVTLTSPMNPENLNDTVIGIDALEPTRRAAAPELLGDIARGRPPGL